MSLLRTIPASSAENERGFSLMKVTKTDRRSKMTTATLSSLLTISLTTPDVQDYDPSDDIQRWMDAGSWRPLFKDGRGKVDSGKRLLRYKEEEVNQNLDNSASLVYNGHVANAMNVTVAEIADSAVIPEEDEVQFQAVQAANAEKEDDVPANDETDDEGFEDYDEENELTEDDVNEMLKRLV